METPWNLLKKLKIVGIFSLDHRTCQGGEDTLKPLIHYLPRFGSKALRASLDGR